MLALARGRVARVAALPAGGIARVEADRGVVVAPGLPADSQFDRSPSLEIDEGVLAGLPVALEPDRQPVGQAVFGEASERAVAPPGRDGSSARGRPR